MTSSGFLPYGFEVTVERETGYDGDGVPLAADDPHTIKKCAADMTQTVAVVGGQYVVTTNQQIICDDVDADVQPADTLTLPDGSKWRVSGEIERLRSPLTGWAPGCVIPVERVSGSIPPQIIQE